MSDKEKTIISPNVKSYVGSVSASGARTKHANDIVGMALEGATVAQVKKAAKAMGIDDVDKYDHLNPGQIRMNLGNRIRGVVNRANKEESGYGDRLLQECTSDIRKEINERMRKEAEAKAEAKTEAKKAKTAKKTPAKKAAA